MRWMVMVILLALAVRLPFAGSIQTLCISTDHVAVDCHSDAADAPCLPTDDQQPCSAPGEDDCVDLSRPQPVFLRERGSHDDAVSLTLFAFTLPLLTDVRLDPMESGDPPLAWGDSPPPSFRADRHARTIVIRC